MTFGRIKRRLVYGQKVRRGEWPEGVYIQYDGVAVTMRDAETEGVLKRYALADRAFSMEDVFAEDWGVLKPR